MFLCLSRDIANELVDTTAAAAVLKARKKNSQTKEKRQIFNLNGEKNGIVLSLARVESDKWETGRTEFSA